MVIPQFLGQLVPKPDHPSSEYIFPNIKSKPVLVQLEDVSPHTREVLTSHCTLCIPPASSWTPSAALPAWIPAGSCRQLQDKLKGCTKVCRSFPSSVCSEATLTRGGLCCEWQCPRLSCRCVTVLTALPRGKAPRTPNGFYSTLNSLM